MAMHGSGWKRVNGELWSGGVDERRGRRQALVSSLLGGWES